MKRKLGPIEKFKPLWEGGKSVEQRNIKIGFKIRMYVVNELNSLRQKDPSSFGPKETEELTKMIMDLKQDKGTISQEDQQCSLEEFQQFLSDFFSKVDYEDRHETVTMKTISKFRLMASFIDVLASWEPIDEEMLKCKKYCQFKAVDIFKSLKKGEVPKRGGPHEQESLPQGSQGDDGLGNEIEEMSKDVNNMNFNNNQGMNNTNNQYQPYGGNTNMNNYGMGGNYDMNNMNNTNNMNNMNNNPYSHTVQNNQNTGFVNPFGGSQPNQNQNQFQSQGGSTGFSNPFGPSGGNNNNFSQSTNPQSGGNFNNQFQKQAPQSQRQFNNNSLGNEQNKMYSNTPRGNNNNNNHKSGSSGGPRRSKVLQSKDNDPHKRLFKGKYELNAGIPVKYQSVDYYMLVENVRLNNENALRELKRGNASDILNTVLDSLEFLSYIHK